ncbi:uncharacterized protein LOC112464669 [Temnothorax curvispinosus]|uniref:ribonuclease H n=1 Tax=Temnothorax curvispinosus TaxID=300111 RepID=A0A6J1QXZ1_9HYME|nr:uncharacterized protein LOC112461466 [Temnothorax curvispinosus]XP_024887574.1 uncharacterized protein LOC112464669 [Temnothorax curvispinosus]
MKYKKEDYELIDEFKDKYNQKNIKFIYTDRSRIEGNPSVGAGIVIEEEEEDAYYASLPKNSSVYTAEAYAINAALRKIEDKLERENKEEEEMIIILSDNQGVIKAIKNNRLDVYKNKYILDIRRRHHKIKTRYNKRIIYAWIPSHKGFTGNEMADKLAKTGTEEDNNKSIEVPIQDYMTIFKEEAKRRTQEKIKNEASYKGRDYFRRYYDEEKKKPWFHKIRTERYFYTWMNRIRANHYNLNESLARKEYIATPDCECGNYVEDINHVVWECRKYDDQKERLNEELEIRNLRGTEDIFEIIRREDWMKISVIFRFIKKLNRII